MTPGKRRINQLRQKQSLLYIMVFSLATVMVWVAISLVTSQKKTGISPELQKLALPLTPTLNQETLQKVERRTLFTESELARFPIYKLVTAANGVDERVVTIETAEEEVFARLAPSPSPEPSPSPTLTPSPSPVATQSATVPQSTVSATTP